MQGHLLYLNDMIKPFRRRSDACAKQLYKKVNRSEKTALTFLIPKKDQTVHFISGFRELNKRIRREPFPQNLEKVLFEVETYAFIHGKDDGVH